MLRFTSILFRLVCTESPISARDKRMGEIYEHARDSEETRHFARYPLLPALRP